MTENLHTRAQQLLAQSLIEGLAPADDAWLKNHLAECAECSREATTTSELLRALRTVPVMIPRDLAARTQVRVGLRAQESAQSSQSGLILWLLAATSWLLGLMSAPLVWRGFAWLGGEFGLPKLVVQMGFVFWWIVPALFAVAAVLHQRAFGSAAKSL
jgi:hypothetical protein